MSPTKRGQSGSAKIPIMDIGAEGHDFNFFSDVREGGGGYRIGNVGEVFRYFHAATGEFGMQLTYGRPLSGVRSLAGTRPSTRGEAVEDFDIEDALNTLIQWAESKGYQGRRAIAVPLVESGGPTEPFLGLR